METQQDPLDELLLRKQNFEQIIAVCEFEIAIILQQIEDRTKIRKIWYKYQNNNKKDPASK